tara:strand:- start:318 stop:803 length:486 start_codon:yes stop_codon:yes gene_type:complete
MIQIKGLPLNSIILFLGLITIITLFITYLAQLEQRIISQKEKQKEKQNQQKNNDKYAVFKGFLLKNTIIAGSIAFVIGLNTRDFIRILSETLINPLFSVDLDKDGNPDFTEITNMLNLNILGAQFKLGQFILALIHYLFFIVVIYIIVILLYINSDFIKIE